MKLKRGPSGFWAAMHRWRLSKPRMPFWRVVVEARLDRRAAKWPERDERRYDGAVVAVYVWARTIEEAEGLAALALEHDGLITLTADAVKHPPAARPSRKAIAVSRGAIGFINHVEDDTSAPRSDSGPSRRDARA